MKSKTKKRQYKSSTSRKVAVEKEVLLLNYASYFFMLVFTITSFIAFYNSVITNKSSAVCYVICVLIFFGLSIIQVFKNKIISIIKM